MIIVAGTFRIPEEKIDDFLPIACATLAATRAEEGCITYSYAFDVEDRGLIRVYEEWKSIADLNAHLQKPHMKPWRAKLAELGAHSRNLKRLDTCGLGVPV